METREQTATSETPELKHPPACPVCGGILIESRSLWRCTRCSYSLCEGCEGGTASD